jgi:uncharacterized protein (DUF302 family)
MNRNSRILVVFICCLLAACANQVVGQTSLPVLSVNVPKGLPPVDLTTAIYEIPVKEGVKYADVVDSLKSISEGKNFVNPANFPIGEHMIARGQSPLGVLEVRAFCNLGMGAEIMLDHPEFVVFAPCRIALYEKPNANNKLRLYLALDRPTFDLQSIKNPTDRAKKAAVQLEEALLDIMDKASKGDF